MHICDGPHCEKNRFLHLILMNLSDLTIKYNFHLNTVWVILNSNKQKKKKYINAYHDVYLFVQNYGFKVEILYSMHNFQILIHIYKPEVVVFTSIIFN